MLDDDIIRLFFRLPEDPRSFVTDDPMNADEPVAFFPLCVTCLAGYGPWSCYHLIEQLFEFS